ncbi:shikimate dehydrogenase [Bacillus sp. DJP31]|uniref:shikimate dehydrogenase n=1 Tax=Bacillus sp. DJP31 TaxID=3409789 RepID=UPI003BB67A80
MEKLYGVIGDPISQSMSPSMHNAAFSNLGLTAKYMAFHVTPDRLPAAIEGIRGLGIAGLNVTIPHKVSIMTLLDEIDPLAKKIGAVNTIVNEFGKLIGYNTDGAGYVTSLKEAIPKKRIQDQSILLIGAGGAARAIYFTLIDEGVEKVDIANRTKETARQLIHSRNSSSSLAMDLSEAESVVDSYDIIINTTSIGMYPSLDHTPIHLGHIKENTIVSDIIYNPIETKWLRVAKSFGAKTLNGVDMFVFQGALSFEKWTGIYPNIDVMRNVVLNKLGGVN